MEDRKEELYELFFEEFGTKPIIVHSPGRVNLIGEHTDYNNGFVLPAAIDKKIVLAMAANSKNQIRLVAADMDQEVFETAISLTYKSSDLGWPNYILGVVDQLQKSGFTVGGFDCIFGGDIPIGAGLSSSAALEGGMVSGLAELFDLKLSRLEMAKLGQRTENQFVGVQCGIMDQFANLHGKAGSVIRLDCRSMEHTYYPFERDDIAILLCDTNVRRELATSEYNVRRQQCEQGVQVLQKFEPSVKSLRDVTEELLNKHKDELDPVVYNRCRYIVEENQRVLDACDYLLDGDVQSFGKKMAESHAGLRDLYEVSCRELDVLVEATKEMDAVLGSRMMGGGFGGCTINLVLEKEVGRVIQLIKNHYEKEVGGSLDFYIAQISEGVFVEKTEEKTTTRIDPLFNDKPSINDKSHLDSEPHINDRPQLNEKLTFYDKPHRRLNILTGEWVQISPNRTQRPWQGKEEKQGKLQKPEHDQNCYLCPGNERAGGVKNPKYSSTFAFDNDFSALLSDTDSAGLNHKNLFVANTERGICRVICFSPCHDLTLPEMDIGQIRNVVDVWVDEYRELGSKPFINYVQIFENKGEMMGCSNPHPHGQIWAQETIPEEPAKELIQQKNYFEKNGRTLLGDYLEEELKEQTRVVAENDDFVVLVPFWAFWPFETLVVSRRVFGRFTDMTDQEKTSLAAILKTITVKYDQLFNISFPYSAGFHPAPTDGKEHPEWHFHMHFYPPLLRSATIKKFRVGYEMLANPQRDITAESAAELLREQPEI